MTKNTITNKGNYSFETKEREDLFHEHKGEGWSQEYKKYRINSIEINLKNCPEAILFQDSFLFRWLKE